MAEPRSLPPGVSGPYNLPASPTASTALDALSYIPSDLCLISQSFSVPPCTLQLDSDLRALLQALLTKSDIELLIGRIEENHSKEMHGVKSEVQSLFTRLSAGESTMATLTQRMWAPKSLQDIHVDAAVSL